MTPPEGQILKPAAIIVCICINWVLGAYHGSLVKRMESETVRDGHPTTKIKHGWWGAGYAAFVTLIVWGISEKLDERFSWLLLTATLTCRVVVFNLAINSTRGKGLWYVSPEVKNRRGFWDALMKGKFVDWIHYKIFGNTIKWQSLFYAAATVALTIISIK